MKGWMRVSGISGDMTTYSSREKAELLRVLDYHRRYPEVPLEYNYKLLQVVDTWIPCEIEKWSDVRT